MGTWEGYTGTPPVTLPWTHIQLNSASRPYLRPNEGELRYLDEVSQIGSRMGPELTRIDLRYDPPGPVPRWSRDDPQMTHMTLRSASSQTAVSNNTVFKVLLTVAEEITLSSKDWIRPPSRCQE